MPMRLVKTVKKIAIGPNTPLLDLDFELWGDSVEPIVVCSGCGSSCDDTDGCSVCVEYARIHSEAATSGCAALVVVTESLWRRREQFPGALFSDKGISNEMWRLPNGSEVYEGKKYLA